MRDPDLVMRAERAAIALEQAWGRWRVMHGLDTGPLPPVTSYVGYSLEEPWGQPRVVFGVAAEEAERLAALLNGHDCVGPVHAEVSSRPDWRRTAPGSAGAVHDAPARDSVGVPAQRPQPASDLLPPGRQPDSAKVDKAPEKRQAPGRPVAKADAREQPHAPLASRSQLSGMLPAVPMLPVPSHDRGRPGRNETRDPRTRNAGDGQPESVPRRTANPADEASATDEAHPVGIASGVEYANPYDEPIGPALFNAVAEEFRPRQGSGNRGRRYQGFPPRYESGPDPDPRLAGHDPTAEDRDAADPEILADREVLADREILNDRESLAEHEEGAQLGNAADLPDAEQLQDVGELPDSAELPDGGEAEDAVGPEIAVRPEIAIEPEDAVEPDNAAVSIEQPETAARRKLSKRTRSRRPGGRDASGRPQSGHAHTDATV